MVNASRSGRPRVVAITQARMGSSRLPGKVMAPVLGRPLLEWHLARLRRSERADAVVVAAPDLAESAPIVELCARLGVAVVLGSQDDVLSRYALAARRFEAEVVVRVTSDCPFIDPELVDRTVGALLEGGLDYATLDTGHYPRGLDVEALTRAALDAAQAEAEDPYEREHALPFVYRRPERFVCRRVGRDDGGRPHPYRLCVDEAADLSLARRLAAHFAPRDDFGWREMVAALGEHPDWAAINAHVRQKPA